MEELKRIVEKEAYAVPMLLELKDLIRRTPPGQGSPVLHFIPSEGPILENPRRCGSPEEEKAAVQRIGIFPSSFNPLTLAHAELVRQAQEDFCLEEVLLVLDSQAMDKVVFGASLEDRLLMLRLFARPFASYRIALSSHGLFLDKLRVLRQLYPSSSTSFYFIVGYDTLVRVLDPKYYADREAALGELFRGSCFLVANRAELAPQHCHDLEGIAIESAPSISKDRPYDLPSLGHGELAGGREEIQVLLDRKENRPFRDRIAFLPLSSFYASLSATLIREKVAQGEEVAGLIPPVIRCFIEETRLYAPPVAVERAGQQGRLDLYDLRNQLLDRLYEVAQPQGFQGFQADLKELLRFAAQDPNL